MLSTVRTSKLKDVVENGRRNRDSVVATSLRIGMTFYATYLTGDKKQRALARRLYLPLKTFVGAAGADGEISLNECSYYDAVIGKSTREDMLKHGLENED